MKARQQLGRRRRRKNHVLAGTEAEQTRKAPDAGADKPKTKRKNHVLAWAEAEQTRKAPDAGADKPKTKRKRYYKKRTVSRTLKALAIREQGRKKQEAELERLDKIVKSWTDL